jgi:hypothetical protein
MTERERTPSWRFWLETHPFTVIPLAILAIGVIMIVVVLQLDSRIDELHNRVEQPPAKRYSPPKPNVPDADRVTWDDAPAGQQVYVPVYSHIYFLGGRPYLLESTLSVRNTDSTASIMINSVDYYDTDGARIKQLLDAPLLLQPFASTEFLIETRDTAGGSGANCVVEWVANTKVSVPIIEAIMVGTAGTQAICFARPGQAIGEK